MEYRLAYSQSFQKHFRSFSDSQQKQIRNKLKILVSDLTHPSLRVKRIKGTNDLWEMSVNMDIRIIWRYEEDVIILLVDIGHHDILKKY